MTRLTTIFVATALTAVALPGAAFAQASAFGSLGLGYVYMTSPDIDETQSGPAVMGAASVAYAFTPELGIQGDVMLNYEHVEFSDSDDILDASLIDGTLHGFYRTDSFLIGGLMQLGRTSTTFNDNDPRVDDRRYLGVEGQAYLGSFTVYGQLGVKQIETPRADFDGYFGKIEGRYFLTPDFRIEGHFAFGTLTQTDVPFDADTTTTLNVGVGAEYKLEDMPFSVFAEYDFYRGQTDSGVLGDRQRVMVGIRFQLEDGTLLDRDRTGPSLEQIEPGGYLRTAL